MFIGKRTLSRIVCVCSLVFTGVLLGGCTATSVYQGTGATFDLHEKGVHILGEVTACEGAHCKNDETGSYDWPLSFHVPPPTSHYQAALRKKAAKQYQVSEGDIVLGEISVEFYTEMVGTVRGWSAKTIAGRKT